MGQASMKTRSFHLLGDLILTVVPTVGACAPDLGCSQRIGAETYSAQLVHLWL